MAVVDKSLEGSSAVFEIPPLTHLREIHQLIENVWKELVENTTATEYWQK